MSGHEQWMVRLEAMGLAVRQHLAGLERGGELAKPVAHEGGDVVFQIDREVEPVIVREIESWPDECFPLLLIAEGFGADGRRVFGEGEPRYRVIVDPIDGTRGLMYDKRSAWFIAAVAPNRGEATSLQDTFAAVLVELPTSKQGWCDSYVAARGIPTTGQRIRVGGRADETSALRIRPSAAADLRHGFAQVANYFPGTKVLASDLMELIVAETLGAVRFDEALVFDDQYISSGGQMAELIAGHDRFTCDLRPIFYRIAGGERGLECHPYDVACLLVATQAGVVITDAFGAPLDAPLNVTTGVHWCGYANEKIARLVQPVIAKWLESRAWPPI